MRVPVSLEPMFSLTGMPEEVAAMTDSFEADVDADGTIFVATSIASEVKNVNTDDVEIDVYINMFEYLNQIAPPANQ